MDLTPLQNLFAFQLLLIPATLQLDNVEHGFIRDYIGYHGLQETLVVVRHELGILDGTGDSVIVYGRGEEQKLADHLFLNWERFDAVVFAGSGGGHKRLIGLLKSRVADLFHGQTRILVRGNATCKYSTRFDNHLQAYKLNENGSVTISESYRIKKSACIKQDIGAWSSLSGLKYNTPNIWERRRDLKGMTIKATYVEWTKMAGLLVDIVKELELNMNFTLRVERRLNSSYGASREDGTWSGQVGALMKYRMDVDVSGLTNSPERLRVIDFSRPIYDTSYTLLGIRRNKPGSHYVLAYHDILSVPAWTAVAVALALTGLAFFVIEESYTICAFLQIGIKRRILQLDVTKSACLVFFHALQMSYDDSPHQRAATKRLLIFTSGLTTYLLYAHYTALLTTTMTSGPPQVPIRSFRDVLKTGATVLTRANTGSYLRLQHARNGTAMREYYEKRIRDSDKFLVDSTVNALKRVSKLTAASNVPAFFFGWGIAYINYRDELPDNGEHFYALSLEDSVPAVVCLAFPKGSQLRPIFDSYLLKLNEWGVADKLRTKWFGESTGTPIPQSSPTQAASLGFEGVSFPFVLIAAAMTISFVIAVAERVRWRTSCSMESRAGMC